MNKDANKKIEEMVKAVIATADASLIQKVTEALKAIEAEKSQSEIIKTEVPQMKYMWVAERVASDGNTYNAPIVGMTATNFEEGMSKLDISDNIADLQTPRYRMCIGMMPVPCKIVATTPIVAEKIQSILEEYTKDLMAEASAIADITGEFYAKHKTDNAITAEDIVGKVLCQGLEAKVAISDDGTTLIDLSDVTFNKVTPNYDDYDEDDDYDCDCEDCDCDCDDCDRY